MTNSTEKSDAAKDIHSRLDFYALSFLDDRTTPNNEFFTHLKEIREDMGKLIIQDTMRSLRERGMCVYSRTLVNEEGQPNGSGYQITQAGVEHLSELRRKFQ
jgi:DNA-binding PadR family transcriptional regulator